ncbi:hypoxanthine phosphoribosyltransferase [Parabacteroides sp. PF5-9]|uniref:hypoxanthine phosphoribosyltransferase n=1 Tax=Parabacteroides sp. PF5-9 TaxID=1742404 RepID=UPI002476199B|nr:hypoxanthine phosphoribosyltransferase [Parabacteroides sp. PF5-9]MDH6356229.1 hypoxanthine phosphoribosyltransferase [Parabacteroides sp. PF5-9]
MDTIRLRDKEFSLFITEQEIREAITKMATRIKADIKESNPLFVSVLNGAFMFTAELMRELDGPYELTFARYSSYKGTSTSGEVKEIVPLQTDIRGRMVILLEDIIDTGLTMEFVMKKLLDEGAAEVRVATMLFKPEALKALLKPDYVGFEIPTDFIVGHGLDYDEMGRSYKDIYKLNE